MGGVNTQLSGRWRKGTKQLAVPGALGPRSPLQKDAGRVRPRWGGRQKGGGDDREPVSTPPAPAQAPVSGDQGSLTFDLCLELLLGCCTVCLAAAALEGQPSL